MTSFFQELRRRNVYKVAVAYAVVAWLLIQIATQVFPFFEVPNWAVRLVVLLLVIGFPIALIIAWAFELTPEGIKRTENADAEMTPFVHKKHTWLYVVVVAGVLSIVVFYVGSYSARSTPVSSKSADEAKAAASIAVLPFDNMSSDKENAYFASGIQDEILTKLAGVEGLKVISRSSTEKYRSHPEDVRKVASELGVATLLEGSVQKVGDSAHINVQLIDAANDAHLWAQTYDRQLKDIFAVEGEVAGQVASALKGKLLPATTAKLAAPPTQNPEAYDLYLRGLYAHDEWFRGSGSPDDGIRFMREALAHDPNFVGALARLAIYEAQKYGSGLEASEELAQSAQALADRALALDSHSPEALMAKGIVIMRIDHDFAGALNYFDRVRAISQADDRVWLLLSIAHANLGQMTAAIEAAETAVSLNPRSSHYLDALATAYGLSGRLVKAIETEDRAHQVEPNDWVVVLNKADFLLKGGQLDAAADVLRSIPPHVGPVYDHDVVFTRWQLATLRRDFASALAIAQTMSESDMPRYVGERDLLCGRSAQALGRVAEAEEAYRAARRKVEAVLELDRESYLHPRLARILAGLRDEDGAIREAEKAIALGVTTKAASDGTNTVMGRYYDRRALVAKAEVLTMLNRVDAAIDTLEQLAADPASGLEITPALLRVDPMWDPLRGNPRFEKLCNEK